MIVESARTDEKFRTELADRLCLPRMNRAPNDILEAVSQDKQRAEALVEVLREAPEPPNFAGLANLGVDPWTWVEHYREWYESRAAALADEPRKETTNG